MQLSLNSINRKGLLSLCEYHNIDVDPTLLVSEIRTLIRGTLNGSTAQQAKNHKSGEEIETTKKTYTMGNTETHIISFYEHMTQLLESCFNTRIYN